MLNINGRLIGDGEPCYVIAECADAHHGSTDMAIAMVDMARDNGADAVKFQHHIPDEEMLPDMPTSSNMEEPLYDFIKRNALTMAQHGKVSSYCKDTGIQYLCTPFSWVAAQEINHLVPAFKIGSGEAQDFPFLARVANLGKPMVISTGMSTAVEVCALAKFMGEPKGKYALMHCVSEYPPAYEDLNIDLIDEFTAFGVPVGYSDHTDSIWTALAAATLGASIIEKHVTLSRSIKGPDADVSITGDQLNYLVTGIRAIEKSRGREKTVHAKEEAIRSWAFRSLVVTENLKAGDTLSIDNLWSKRPGTGIPSKRMPEYLGRKVKVGIPKNTMLTEDMLCG